jgi:uncharacterized protein YceK
MKKLSLIISIIALCGCASVPATKATFGGHSFTFPKDSSADKLELSVRSGANELIFKADNWSTKNNPAVIGASTEQIRAHYQGAEGLVKTAIEAAEKGAAKSVVPIP